MYNGKNINNKAKIANICVTMKSFKCEFPSSSQFYPDKSTNDQISMTGIIKYYIPSDTIIFSDMKIY